MFRKIKETTCFIENAVPGFKSEYAIILGSGLGEIFSGFKLVQRLPYRDIPNFPVSTVAGHSGELLFGMLEDRAVIIMSGRFHYYEGYSMTEVVFPVRVLCRLGVKTLLITNAAGGVNPDFQVGDLVALKDHLNFLPNPLIGKNLDEIGPRFPDMSATYDKELIRIAEDAAVVLGIPFHTGCYVGLTGPSFETPAEYQAYRMLGGDMIGMSTVPEVIAARHAGLRCFAVSVITNQAFPGKFSAASHVDVLHVAGKAGKNLAALLKAVLRGL
jgi:purine-nucleoside phosphorylase